MENIKFYKVTNIKNKGSLDCSIYASMENLVDDIRMCYARDCYWINEHSFYEGVETPTTKEEAYSSKDDKKYWNWHLSNLISLKEKDELLSEIIKDWWGQEIVFIIMDICGKEVYGFLDRVDRSLFELFDFEDVTDEYYSRFLDAINKEEIEEFTSNNHTQDEIEEKYCSWFVKENNDSFSMWEL